MMRAARTALGVEAGEETERNADDRRKAHGQKNELEGGRQARQDQIDGRNAVDEGASEIAFQGVAQEGEVLLPDRQIEPEAPDHRRALGGADLRRNQEFDRVSDAIDGKEDHDRDREQNQDALDQTLQDVGRHVEAFRSARGLRLCLLRGLDRMAIVNWSARPVIGQVRLVGPDASSRNAAE